MQRKMVVIDTNVLVSAAIGLGFASKIVWLFTKDAVYDVSYSEKAMNEYNRVASYTKIEKKYPFFKENIKPTISELEFAGYRYVIQRNFTILEDFSDNKFLDLAYACQAD